MTTSPLPSASSRRCSRRSCPARAPSGSICRRQLESHARARLETMRFAEMIVEPQPTAFWRQLGQLGVEDAVIALPRGFQDWRQGRIDHPWSYNSIALYQELLAEE